MPGVGQDERVDQVARHQVLVGRDRPVVLGCGEGHQVRVAVTGGDRQLDEEAIFHLARKINGQEVRDAYLRQSCGGDEALRGRVEALLRVHDEESRTT